MPTDEGPAATNPEPAEGLVDIDGRPYFAIPHVDRMAPFLMSVVSDGDRWMFVSSSGALTAGRRDAAHAIFPYETDDRLHLAAGKTGPVTVIRAGDRVWQPLAPGRAEGGSRRLAKAVTGDVVVFEERDDATGLAFTARWASCDRFGFVRTVTVRNHGGDPIELRVLDGLVNVLPAGLDPTVTQRLSNLANAYKRSELVAPRLGVFSLESPVSDRPDPEEVLRATTVWSVGLPGGFVTVDADRLDGFRLGTDLTGASLVTGRPGAYLIESDVSLAPAASVTWQIVVDADRDQFDVAELVRLLDAADDVGELLESETSAATRELERIMAKADADQCTGDGIATAHHVANVTYNVMRGGVPLRGYRVDRDDLARFVAQRNRPLAERHAAWFRDLARTADRTAVIDRARETGDVHLLRLVREYLPFSFSRRHGDPSRPWNAFSIRVRDGDGDPVMYYEGNWRDVFQNWEALCATHPLYLPGVVSAFVNASTVDGFNPYRITRDGIDWEVPDPDDPWANIGYWGDHQIVYLHRLLEACERHLPGELAAMLGEDGFTFADVPYRIAPYEQLLDDPKSTITYDADAAARSEVRVGELGGDGRLCVDADGRIVTTTLMEKLLVTALARLSNYVPDGGIWMNTQRPEWNDANNALVGYGLSMVTASQLRAFLVRLRELARTATSYECDGEVVDWLREVAAALGSCPAADGRVRRSLLDRLGGAFSRYRSRIHAHGFVAGSVDLAADEVVGLCTVAIDELDRAIRAARRPDGLFHSYRLLRRSADGESIEIGELPEMLEGQVAALSSGVLDAEERADLVEALFDSALYRPDQQTFLLAPVRHLPSFLDKNVVVPAELERAPLLGELIAAGDGTIVREDAAGRCRFAADLVDAPALDAALDALDRPDAVAAQRTAIHEIYERVFAHRAHLGRSGSMYGYEGIGSIYWHMVTKLLLAVQEAAAQARDDGAPADTVERLVAGYVRVRDGLGFRATAERFGAVPTDPYSHTPSHAGAQQPGMTGAVKEELLARPLELGVRVAHGELVVDPLLLGGIDERAPAAANWRPIGIDDRTVAVDVPAGAWGLTVCQVPVVVTRDGGPSFEVEMVDGSLHRIDGPRLGRELSSEIFGRSGRIAVVRATV